jgi:hypothetical protein
VQLQQQKTDGETKLKDAETTIGNLQNDLTSKELQLKANLEENQKNLAQVKEDLRRRFTALTEERSREDENYNRLHEEKNAKYQKIEKDIADLEVYFNKQKTGELQESQFNAERLKTEIKGIEAELAKVENEYPQLLNARRNEIISLEKQLVERGNFYQQQKEQADRSMENFQRRTERRVQLYKGQLEQLRDRHKSDMAEADERLAAIKAQLEKKESAAQEELARCGKQFTEDKYKLEKQKSELEEKLKDLQFQSREQLRQKEKEILSLQGQLAEKETVWQQSWKQKEEELAQEKTALAREIETLDAKLKEEEDIARRRMTDSLESTYTVPVPGTRKKRVSKYCRSSTERGFRRCPLTVRIHFDRKRVSNENSPVGSVRDASMSPRSSLMTKVLPSRILTTESLTSWAGSGTVAGS